jgi:hypothetical protein
MEENPQLTEKETHDELAKMAYSREDFEKVVTFVWALPDQFWARVCKRLVATVIIGLTLSCGLSEPKIPCVCQRNLHDCLYSYDGNNGKDVEIGWSKWEALCKQDLHVCQSNWGMK